MLEYLPFCHRLFRASLYHNQAFSFAKEYRLIKRQLKSEQSGLGLALFLLSELLKNPNLSAHILCSPNKLYYEGSDLIFQYVMLDEKNERRIIKHD